MKKGRLKDSRLKDRCAVIFAVLISFFIPVNCPLADDMLTNAPADPAETQARGSYSLSPGALILLPDGSKTVIDSVLPDGNFQTEEGVKILRDGSLPGGSGRVEILMPGQSGLQLARGSQVRLPDGRIARLKEKLSSGDWKTDLGVILAPDGTIRDNSPAEAVQEKPINAVAAEASEASEKPEKNLRGAQPEKGALQKAPYQGSEQKKGFAEVPGAAENGQKHDEGSPASALSASEKLTIAAMLPMTSVNQGAREPQEEQKALPGGSEPGKNAKNAAPAKKESEKNAGFRPEAGKQPSVKEPAGKNASEKKAQEAKNAAKTPLGKELSIPPDAAKSGNLDFLEGCWQGTRPEYYSKRTIKECFCFGPNGTNGKRRVYDPEGQRKCIGATTAHLASNGVLSVTSSGAACDDGERWGQAEMQCKNSGPRTPCSWIFRDANNGRQAYQIPFVRVESCGR